MGPRLRKIPAHLRGNRPRLFLLRRWANVIACRYRAPVYLVGSALRDDNYNPRDWDVRVVLTYQQFAERYATPARRLLFTPQQLADQWLDEAFGRKLLPAGCVHDRWSAEMNKATKEAYQKYLGLNVDFQVYPPFEWRAWIIKKSPYWRISR